MSESTIPLPANFGMWAGPAYAGGTIFGSASDPDGRLFFNLYDENSATYVQPRGYIDAAARGFDIEGGSGDDLLTGTAVSDRMSGGTGSDVLMGGAGDDSYYFNGGDGLDSIVDLQGINTIKFGLGLTAQNMSLAQSVTINGQRYLEIDFGNDDRLSIRAGELGSIQSFGFADGSALSAAELLAMLPRLDLVGGDDDDVLQDFAGNDLLEGGKGDDTITGGAGDDVFVFGRGNDLIWQPRIKPESRRWRHGDPIMIESNEFNWRIAA